ncbi:alkaline phosphatase isozyme conversion protein precursor [Lachnospiraceae bacterium KM106-2]|nr:alkaline phosphatase isozyme conversion protein precursor [Lachnospiraceae bacterium KM106-2]
MKKRKRVFAGILVLVFCMFSLNFYPIKAANEKEDEVAVNAKRYLDYMGIHLKVRSNFNDLGKVIKKNQHKAALTWIKKEIVKAGIPKSSIKEQNYKYTVGSKAKNYTGTNLIVTLRGKSNAKQIIVGSHYDGDGYGDNASGVALNMAMIKKLAHEKVPYTIRFVFFDGEELGLLGSTAYAHHMKASEVKKTMFMVNMDSLVFGDYCNIYGGLRSSASNKITQLQGYLLAVKKVKELGMKVYGPKELNGYYKKHKRGPKIEKNAIYTNPWTFHNGSPADGKVTATVSPMTLDASDHVAFKQLNIPYIYFEATNWYAKGDGGIDAYTGYYETIRDKIGKHGMFMNTKYDTKKNLEKYFPKRAMEHFKLYGTLLTKLLKEPDIGKDHPSTY